MVTRWQKIQTIAEIVIAVSAVAGLAFAFYQNWTTTRGLPHLFFSCKSA
jgi:hypothetical protein